MALMPKCLWMEHWSKTWIQYHANATIYDYGLYNLSRAHETLEEAIANIIVSRFTR